MHRFLEITLAISRHRRWLGDTIPTADSCGAEVQSIPNLTQIEKHYHEQLFETWEDARMYYTDMLSMQVFFIKSSTSRNSVVDKQKDKWLFVCNKSGKNEDINKQEAPPVRQQNGSLTKKTDCRARPRVKRRGQKWCVNMFVEEHNH